MKYLLVYPFRIFLAIIITIICSSGFIFQFIWSLDIKKSVQVFNSIFQGWNVNPHKPYPNVWQWALKLYKH